MKALDLIIRIATLIALAAIALALTRLEEHFRSSVNGSLEVEVRGHLSE